MRVCVYHHIQALKRRPLGHYILQPVREHAARTSVLKHGSCHWKVLRIVKH